MKIGLLLDYARIPPMDLIKQAEDIGYDSIWVAEAYGLDAVSVAAWVLAQTRTITVGTSILQVPARTPAMTAMSAMSLSQLSGGRFILGLGASGPQVVEGWHGVPYARPLTRLRECIEIVRAITAREAPVSYEGDIYHLPYKGEGSVGLGKPLKSILKADPDIPIYTASFTPASFRLSGELVDGLFAVFMSPEKINIISDEVEKGFSKAVTHKTFKDFDIVPFINVYMGDDLDACRLLSKQHLALYIGGMGAKDKNFYNDFVKKLGYEEAAVKIQDLYLAGNRAEAEVAVPDALVDELSLVGSKQRIQERAQQWLSKSDYIKTMIFTVTQPEVLPVLAEIFS